MAHEDDDVSICIILFLLLFSVKIGQNKITRAALVKKKMASPGSLIMGTVINAFAAMTPVGEQLVNMLICLM